MFKFLKIFDYNANSEQSAFIILSKLVVHFFLRETLEWFNLYQL